MTIGIIGGGAAGMAAALAASEYDTQVVLMERQARLGKKLSATGNGRCNLSNLHASTGGYNGDDPTFSSYAISRFSPEETLEWFSDLGLYTVAEPSGRVSFCLPVVYLSYQTPIKQLRNSRRGKRKLCIKFFSQN